MRPLQHLLDKNWAWAAEVSQNDPTFFKELSLQQSPEYLWIGCSDSRVPANQIVGLKPGELFVHRNVANMVVHSDLNCLSVIQFAVDVLKVRHVIVCGHYECSGVRTALRGERVGLADNWLRHVQDAMHRHSERLRRIESDQEKLNRLCELNVIEQVLNVCQTTIVNDAWTRGQDLTVHGWVYGLRDGRIRDLNMSVQNFEEIASLYQCAAEQIFGTSP